jgi:nicotinamide-nucleotide amidase
MTDLDALAQETLTACRTRGDTVATAESCTGGMVAASLTAIAGSSDVVECGFVTYSNGAKQQMLGVVADSLLEFGAVSEQVAFEMAQGALNRSGASLAVSITGIAGPGGSDHKPEGRVCFGLATAQGTTTCTQEFGAIGRANVRHAATEFALMALRQRTLPPH